MTTIKQYDYLNRLKAISNAPAAGVAVSHGYAYNAANRRTQDTLVDGSYWVYQYDSLEQVVSGKKYWRDGTPVAGQQFGYTFDDIGNRTQTQSGGDQKGSNLRTADYSANDLNQITSRDVPGYVDVKGVSIATNTVTVNGNTAYRKGKYFRQELPVANGSSVLWKSVTVAATGQTSVTGNVYVAQTPEDFSYDADGNLTNDGRFAYVWDGENRLVAMTNNTGVGLRYGMTFVYDPQGRRIEKIVATNGVPIYTNRFLYDGWNLIAELNPASSLVRSHLWGSDLSGSMQGAGGGGGLLEVSYHGTSTTNCFVAYDANGNVVALVNAADRTVAANYEYGPFGELLRQTGPLAKANPFRFSTKYQDDESGLVYYGYRYYNPSTGRWLSRDPIQESGGLNLFDFLANDGINSVDLLGLVPPVPPWNPPPNPIPPPPPRLLTTDDLETIRETIDGNVRDTPCCCDKGPGGLGVHIAGTASGATVTENATVTPRGCIWKDSLLYFWWDCVSAQHDYANAGSLPGLDWHDYGWYQGGSSLTKTHKGHWPGWHDYWPYADMSDSGRWNWRAAVIFIRCSKNGFLHAGLAFSDNREEWTWRSGGWTDPHEG